ncbi:MAG: hypothetical protein ACJA2G_002751 [Cognaticolwellia sp.]|jgi:hypothetical protein
MKFKMIKAAFTGLVLTVSSLANAGLIYTASSILSAPTPLAGYGASNTIDQSGLSTTYVSGVTDFDTFLGLTPTHTRTGNPANFFASFDRNSSVDFDMGSILNLTRLVLWNYPFSNSAGIDGFSIYSSATEDFLVTSFLGAFNALDDGNSSSNAAQVFDFSDTQSRYLRLIITSTYNEPRVGFSEIAFEASPVPEPSTLAILALGLIGLGARRFKK